TAVLALIVVLLLPALALEAQGGEPGTPAAGSNVAGLDDDTDVDSDQDDDRDDPTEVPDPTDVPDQDDAADPTDAPVPTDVSDQDDIVVPDPTNVPDRDDDVDDPTDVPDRDDNDDDVTGEADVPSTTEPDDAGAGVASLDDPPIQAADATSVEVYCDIRDSNLPNQRIVGTFINFRPGYGDPKVTFTLYDLNNTVVSATGSSPRPADNPVLAAPVTANAPIPIRYEWSGGFSRLTVSVDYPSLDLASYPDSNISLTIACVPEPPPPTQAPPPTVDPLYTPPPIPTAASYSPVITTEMKDTAGNTIADGATVTPGTGIYDIATVSGLPANTSGSVFYQLFRNNCSVFVGNVGFAVGVLADANGVAVAPNSDTFTVPGFPGGFYDWRIVYTDGAVGFIYGACGPETFYVPPPLPSSGTGNAILTCFLDNPPVPGRAGYKVNVSPLPATGTVEVNVTLQLAGNNAFEYKTVTLPPGTTDQLAFSGAYIFAWVNVVFRDAAGEIYAVVNLQGECAATQGPIPTPGPTSTPGPISTSTMVSTATLASTSTAESTSTTVSTATQGSTATAISTSTVVSTSIPPNTPIMTPASTSITTPVRTPAATLIPNTTATFAATGTATPVPTMAATTTPAIPVSAVATDPPDPTSADLPVLTTSLPNTGGGPADPGGSALFLVTAVFLSTLMFAIGWRYRQPVDSADRSPGG
nr:hypothetical protein [Chloroflexia bacterium]